MYSLFGKHAERTKLSHFLNIRRRLLYVYYRLHVLAREVIQSPIPSVHQFSLLIFEPSDLLHVYRSCGTAGQG